MATTHEVINDPRRHIPLDETVNFRDVGGYVGDGGRRIRWRTLFRSDGLSHLSKADTAAISELGLASVFDLRSGQEMAHNRFPVDALSVTYHHLPLVNQLPDPETFDTVPGFMATHYMDFAVDSSTRVGAALTLLSRKSAYPAVIHCAAGKDRTGVLIAIVLALCGVREETIVADYALSERAMPGLRKLLLARFGKAVERVANAGKIMGATPDDMKAFLSELRERFGSYEEYAHFAGVSDATIAELRASLLEG
jgi:protein-tyrosine phosphatase